MRKSYAPKRKSQDINAYWKRESPVPSQLMHLYQEIHVSSGFSKDRQITYSIFYGYKMVVPAEPSQVRPGATVYIRGDSGYIFSPCKLNEHMKYEHIKSFIEDGRMYTRNHEHVIWEENDF